MIDKNHPAPHLQLDVFGQLDEQVRRRVLAESDPEGCRLCRGRGHIAGETCVRCLGGGGRVTAWLASDDRRTDDQDQ